MFNRKKMSEKDNFLEDLLNGEDLKIPLTDEGERVPGPDERETPKEPVRSAKEIELENKLRAETERREAAESKLIGVQVKFDEAKANLEKETSEMRARLMKTLEDRGQQNQFNFLTTLLPVLDNLNLAVAARKRSIVEICELG